MKTANRASRNAGKKAQSAQSAKAAKLAPAKTGTPALKRHKNETTYVTLIEPDGAVINDAEIPRDLAARLDTAVTSYRPPRAPVPPGTINIGPMAGSAERNCVAFTLQMSEDVYKRIDECFSRNGEYGNEPLERAVLAALRLAETGAATQSAAPENEPGKPQVERIKIQIVSSIGETQLPAFTLPEAIKDELIRVVKTGECSNVGMAVSIALSNYIRAQKRGFFPIIAFESAMQRASGLFALLESKLVQEWNDKFASDEYQSRHDLRFAGNRTLLHETQKELAQIYDAVFAWLRAENEAKATEHKEAA